MDENDSGLTFQEWDPWQSQPPVAMIVNLSELSTTDFDLTEVIPLQLETVSRGGRCTCGATMKHIHGMGTRRYVLCVDNDNEFRSRCECLGFATKTVKNRVKIAKSFFLKKNVHVGASPPPSPNRVRLFVCLQDCLIITTVDIALCGAGEWDT